MDVLTNAPLLMLADIHDVALQSAGVLEGGDARLVDLALLADGCGAHGDAGEVNEAGKHGPEENAFPFDFSFAHAVGPSPGDHAEQRHREAPAAADIPNHQDDRQGIEDPKAN